MAKAKRGDTVQVHYTGTLADGSVFDSSRQRAPLEFTIGGGQVIAGFDEGVTGMEVGEERTIDIPADKAYGPHHEDLLLSVGRDQFPASITPTPGQKLQMNQGGRPMVVTVRDVTADVVTLDANHPLAGQDLRFAVELVGIG
jgi:peptidylprolyl isomerase